MTEETGQTEQDENLTGSLLWGPETNELTSKMGTGKEWESHGLVVAYTKAL